MLKKILILLVSAGGGHLSAAKAIAEAVEHCYHGQVSTSIRDIAKEHRFRPVTRMDEAYRWMQKDGIWFWKLLWRLDDQIWLTEAVMRLVYPIFRRAVKRIYCEEQPDLVVSVNSLVNHIPLRVLRRTANTYVPFVTVVTDMVTVHPSWCCPRVDYCMVPTAAARQNALRLGMPAARVEEVGQPVSLSFAAAIAEKSAMRTRLGLDLERPCVLIVGGGDGIGPIYETARALAVQAAGAQLVVVCGHNARLKRRLDAIDWEIPVRVYGFVDNMPELMSASDLLVTKAGPGTLAEAFIAGLPVIIFGYTPGQETANVDYVLNHRAGAFSTEPDEIARIAREWLEPGNGHWQGVVANAASLARPEATLAIARQLYAMLQQGRAWRPHTSEVQRLEAQPSR
jgi:1,2-diacylglycerol 3-beta-galactosyltransferase